MQSHIISTQESGQRLDKFLHKFFPVAGSSFLYKMLRKKNIVLNHRKAEGKEIIREGDQLDFFFSDDTFHKFRGEIVSFFENENPLRQYQEAFQHFQDISVIYEDSDILILNKPAGILTQKAEEKDFSLNEWMIGYLLAHGKINEEVLKTFKPSVLNRLDRNTSGLVLCGISLQGSQALSKMIHDRSIQKYYAAVVKGCIKEAGMLGGVWEKDDKKNQVSIHINGTGKKVCTRYQPLAQNGSLTLLSIELITGKSHQIRAHMADIGHPLLGDPKYGDPVFNEYYRKRYGICHQLLHAKKIIFPDHFTKNFAFLGKSFEAPLPEEFHNVGFSDR